ncbi:MAG: Rne/Rng family ribonuclease [Bacillota bacterium]
MSRRIIINSGIREKRAAVLDDHTVEDMLFERDTYDQIVSNVYKGRVKDVLPGMQAAFVDIGIDKNAFLHISDVFPLLHPGQRKAWEQKKLGIQQVLQPGQQIMVQVLKEPIGSKGPKVSAKITLPGRYFVLLPHENRIGISRRIEDKQERNRLRNIASQLCGDKYGVIVRTNAYSKDKYIVKHDFNYLTDLWQEVQKRFKRSRAPEIIYRDVDLIKLLVRDYLSHEIDKVIVDEKKTYDKLLGLTRKIVPDLEDKIYLYGRKTPIFTSYGIEKEFSRLLQRKVWLDSGGYVIFDSTEALISIDVNTGKYTGNKNLQETVFKTNKEAARTIARQLKLRDIGGIIIIDFIDMSSRDHQQKVLEILEEELSKDRTKTALLGLTRLGLVEMTRKKVREGFGELIQKECPYCEGTGMVLSETTMALNIIRELRRLSYEEDFEAVLIEVHPEVAAVLIGSGGDKLDELEQKLDKDIYITGNSEMHIEDYRVVHKGSKQKLKEMALPVNDDEVYQIEIEDRHINNKDDGIARIKGYIIIVEDAGNLVGQEVKVQTYDVRRTFAKARIVS